MGWGALLEATDLAVCAALGDGEQVIYAPGVGLGDPVTIPCVFDESYFKAQPDGGENGISTAVPAVFLRLSMLSSDPFSDSGFRVTRVKTGTVYQDREIIPDGQGGAVILLREEEE